LTWVAHETVTVSPHYKVWPKQNERLYACLCWIPAGGASSRLVVPELATRLR
jgi:hypothetical protein